MMILLLHSNMVVGVFGEARGAYSRPAPDLMVLERYYRGNALPLFRHYSPPLSCILP